LVKTGRQYALLTVVRIPRASRLVTCRLDGSPARVKCLVKNPGQLMVGESIEAVRDYGFWKEV
jgi:hypothetical protein